jgi:hypothetical protein
MKNALVRESKKGDFFVLEQSGDTVRIRVPKGLKPRE